MGRKIRSRRFVAALAVSVAAAGWANANDFVVPAGNFTDPNSWAGGAVPSGGQTADINNGGTATLNTGDAVSVAELHLGLNAGQSGGLVMNAGALTVSGAGDGDDNAFAVGDLGVGTFDLHGGVLNMTSGDFHIGKSNSGTMTMDGGTVNLVATLRVARGQAASSSGTLTITGGKFNTGTGVVVARGNAGSAPVGTLVVAGSGTFVAGNSLGDGAAGGFVDEGFFSLANSTNTTAHVAVREFGTVKALRLTGRQGHGDLTIEGNGRFYVVNNLGAGNAFSNYGSYLGGGSDSNGDGGNGNSGSYSLVLRGNGLLDVDANSNGRDNSRPDLQGFILARGNSTAQVTLEGSATMIVRQRLVIGGLGGGGTVNLNGFDGQPAGGTNPGGTAVVGMTGGTLSADQLIVGGSGNGTLTATGGRIETKAYNATYDPALGSTTASVNSIRIGMLTGSTGAMTVSGTTTVAAGNELSVGHYGTGTLAIDSGAVVSAGGDLAIGKFGAGTVRVSGGIVSVGGELAVGRAGNGTLRVTGDGALITARNVTVQKLAGSTGRVIAEITGEGHTPVNALENVTINGGTFEVVPTAVPGGAQRWDVLTAGGALTGRFTTLTLPPADAGGRVWSVVYEPRRFTVGVTLPGDADYSGVVNFSDLLALARHYNQSNVQWVDGDFSGDGLVNFSDLLALARNYNKPAPGDVPGASAEFRADLATAFAAVPEPGTVGVLGLGGLGMLARRRRRDGTAS